MSQTQATPHPASASHPVRVRADPERTARDSCELGPDTRELGLDPGWLL